MEKSSQHPIEFSAKNAIIRTEFATHYRLSMQRTKKDIYALIQKGERLHAECKEAFGGMPDTLWESYNSFANTDGGVMVLGIKELADHSPVIEEKYDPARTAIRIAVEVEATRTDPRPTQALSPSARRVCHALCEDTSMTLRGRSSKLGLSKTTVTTAIGTLIKENHIRRVGARRAGYWEILKDLPCKR